MMPVFRTKNVLGTLAPFLSLACGGLPRTPTVPSTDTAFAETIAPPPGVDEDPAIAAQLYPGDVVSLRTIAGEREESTGLTVDERGMLHVPLAGDVLVSGVPLAEAEDRIEHGLRRYQSAVRVSLVVTAALGQQASVVGAVSAPGRYPVVPGMRLSDLYAVAGGPARSESDGMEVAGADPANAVLMRNNERVPVSLALALGGNARHNVRIRPGDSLYVPADVSRMVTILGQVGAPRVMTFRDGLRLTQALALAGGVTRDGNWGDVRVIRGPSTDPVVYTTSIASVVDGGDPDVVLAPGDIVYVASAGHADLRDVMASVTPLLSVLGVAGAAATPLILLTE